MSTQKRKFELFARLQALGFTYGEAVSLRRIEMTLQRWGELECGNDNGHASYCVSRDEQTGKPYMEIHPYSGGKMRRYPVADREAGALRRLAAIVEARNLRETAGETCGNWVVAYHQTDCRGCNLYLLTREQLTPSEYSNQIVAAARNAGAKIHFRDIDGRAPSGCWVCLDMQHTPLWHETFNTEELAAEAYLKVRKLPVPDRSALLPIGQYYTRGLAVCA